MYAEVYRALHYSCVRAGPAVEAAGDEAKEHAPAEGASASAQCRRTVEQVSAPHLLEICGDLKCFVMEETRCAAARAAMVARADTRTPFLLVHLAALGNLIRPVFAGVCARGGDWHRARPMEHAWWVDCVVVQCLKLALCVAPWFPAGFSSRPSARRSSWRRWASSTRVDSSGAEDASELDATTGTPSRTRSEVTFALFLRCFLAVLRPFLRDRRQLARDQRVDGDDRSGQWRRGGVTAARTAAAAAPAVPAGCRHARVLRRQLHAVRA